MPVAAGNLEVEGGAACLILPSGDPVTFDLDDLHLIEQYRWSIQRRPHTNYVRGYIRGSRTAGYVQMHRMLLGLPASDVDHINGNGLDNRRANLRSASRRENNANRRLSTGSSPYRGVHLHRPGKWMAVVSVDNRTTYLGIFNDPWDAAQAYNYRARELWGQFARLNVKEA